jgi:PAS domain S-box-containing protein
MFDSSLAVPLHFTVEFVGFLVAAGGAFLVASRPSLVPGDPARRRLVAAGFLALAVAHVAHGGAFLPADGEEILTLVRAMGFALMLVGLVGKVEAIGSAGATVALRVRDPIPLVPGALALLAAAAAFAGSFRGGPKVYRRLAAGLFLLALSEVFVSVSPSFEFGVGEGNPYPYISHGLKALGYILIGSWFWSSVRLSIRTRFVASFVTLLVIVVLALATTLTGVISNQVEAEELKRVNIQLGAAVESLDGTQIQLLRGARAVTDNEENANAIRRGDGAQLRGGVDDLARQAAELFAGDFIMIDTSVPGQLVYASAAAQDARPPRGAQKVNDTFAIKVAGSAIVADARTAGNSVSVGVEKFGKSLVILAASTVRDARTPTKVVGTVVLGRFIDQFQMERIARDFQPADASLIVDGRTVASTLPRGVQGQDLVPASVEERLDQLPEDGRVELRQSFGNRSFFTALAPLRDALDGRQIGVLALSSPADVVTSTREDVTKALFLIAMAAAAVAMGLAWFSGRRITRPIQELTLAAQEVREGNLQAQTTVSGSDEVGQLGETFNEMTMSMLRLTEDLRLAAREEQHLRGRIETIIESMADGLVAVDANRNVLAFNRQAQRLTGHTPHSAQGLPIDRILAVRNAKGEPLRLPVYDLGAGSTSGVFIYKDDQEPIPVAVTSAVLRDDSDEVAGAVAVIRDMTREREIERMKSEFLSNISHELRTPLTPIKGYAEILTRKEVPPDKAKRFTQGIVDSTARLERIVELLVDFAAMEAGRLAPKSTPVDIGNIVRALGEATEARASRHDVVLDIKSRLPKVVGDERLLKRSLEEVLDNAVKFSPNGGTIRLEVKGVASGNGQGKRRGVAVSISDEGIGIEPEDLQRIFSDFQQLDGSETRAYGGLGLGLAFVQRIVEAHDGSVDVTSAPDEGTRFTITLPGASAGARK